ncbi:UNVERIFIED_CONTAM: hypothetical protein NCL1_19888 [Trichonephila clavipes]
MMAFKLLLDLDDHVFSYKNRAFIVSSKLKVLVFNTTLEQNKSETNSAITFTAINVVNNKEIICAFGTKLTCAFCNMEDDKKFTEDEIFRFRNYRNRFEALSDSDHDSTGEDSSSEEQDEILTTNEDQILPSQVTYRDYIFMPPLDESIGGNEENSKTGKWMLFPFGDLQKLDEFWVALLPLYYDGILTRIKCSTALGSEPGVINCYTANSEDTSDVKKAADAIRDCTDYKCIMYYKTNEASMRGQYLASGNCTPKI